MASESQTTVAPSCRHGTRPLGEKARLPGFGCDSPDNAIMFTVNGAPATFIASQPRSDHDE